MALQTPRASLQGTEEAPLHQKELAPTSWGRSLSDQVVELSPGMLNGSHGALEPAKN